MVGWDVGSALGDEWSDDRKPALAPRTTHHVSPVSHVVLSDVKHNTDVGQMHHAFYTRNGKNPLATEPWVSIFSQADSSAV